MPYSRRQEMEQPKLTIVWDDLAGLWTYELLEDYGVRTASHEIEMLIAVWNGATFAARRGASIGCPASQVCNGP